MVLPGHPHHVVQRGNNRQDVFIADEDRRTYLSLLGRQAQKHQLRIIGYCLMTNHVHLVVVPADEPGLANGIGRTHFIYAQLFNERHDRSGHLWQARFYSCALEPARLPVALRYVEQNPVRSGLVGAAWKYPWSSAAAHVEGVDAHRLIDLEAWDEARSGLEWRDFLDQRGQEVEVSELRRQTMVGRPWASEGLIQKLERRLGRRLHALPRGRPRQRSGEK